MRSRRFFSLKKRAKSNPKTTGLLEFGSFTVESRNSVRQKTEKTRKPDILFYFAVFLANTCISNDFFLFLNSDFNSDFFNNVI